MYLVCKYLKITSVAKNCYIMFLLYKVVKATSSTLRSPVCSTACASNDYRVELSTVASTSNLMKDSKAANKTKTNFFLKGVLYFGWPNQPTSGTMKFFCYKNTLSNGECSQFENWNLLTEKAKIQSISRGRNYNKANPGC